MERMWAPWRMEFITSVPEEGCLFCNRAGRHHDEADYILQRGQHVFTLLNKYPYGNGHLMVVPYLHTDRLGDLSEETAVELISVLGRWGEIVKQELAAQGLNIGVNLGQAGGAGVVGHLHFHLVPRWVGDTNFMPVLAETKILSEHLGQTYQRLKKAWEGS